MQSNISTPISEASCLQVEQEAADLQRYRLALIKRQEASKALAESLQDMWVATSGIGWFPDDHVVLQLLARYSPEVVEAAMRDVAAKVSTGYVSNYKWPQYLWAVARNISDATHQ